jgi:hypothetical protein
MTPELTQLPWAIAGNQEHLLTVKPGADDWSYCCSCGGWFLGMLERDDIDAMQRFEEHYVNGQSPMKHLGGPDDDHYAVLAIQPLEAIEAWSKTWPPSIAYHLGEAVASIARCATKGQTLRDLKKAHFLVGRAVEQLERESKS